MKVPKYQTNQKLNFGAKFINNVKNLDIDTNRIGAVFEELTKDSPGEKLILEEQENSYVDGDVFTLTDRKNNELAKVACAFSFHSKFNNNPDTQALLLNNIYRVIKKRSIEISALKKIKDEIANLRKQERILLDKEDEFIDQQAKNILQDAKEYDIEILDLKPEDKNFNRFYNLAQYSIERRYRAK